MGYDRTFRLGTLTQVLAFLALIPATMYPLGLLILALQLSDSYSHEFFTSFSAAQLVSKPSVLALGVHSIYNSVVANPELALFAFLMAFVAVNAYLWQSLNGYLRRAPEFPLSPTPNLHVATAVHMAAKLQQRADSRPPSRVASPRGRFSLLMGALGVLEIANLLLTDKFAFTSKFWADVIVWMSVVICSVALMELRDAEMLSHRWISVVSIFFVLAIFAATVIRSAPQRPNLADSSFSDQSGTTVSGKLLAHSDGYWYYFDNSGELIALRDDAVKHVTILGH